MSADVLAMQGAPAPGAGLPPRWYFTVGPTQLHPVVPGAIREALSAGLPSWSHRSGPARADVARTVEALRGLLGIPADHRVLFVSSATEAMERIVEGAVQRRSAHLVNGAFARRFRSIARNLGRETEVVEVSDGEGFDLDAVVCPPDVELVALTQNETSTGVALDPAGIAGLAHRHPEVLVAVDTVTATPLQRLDLSVVDAAFFSVQKLFGLPAGLGVLVASPRLVERARERQVGGLGVGGYLHIPALAEAADRNETVATPNSLGIQLLGRVAEAYLERGIETLRSENASASTEIEAAAREVGWIPFPSQAAHRSSTVLVFQVPGGSAPIRARLEAAGFPVASGYGAHRDAQLRIACFPVHPPLAVQALARLIRG
jgi:phosphoserine aminotransferase